MLQVSSFIVDQSSQNVAYLSDMGTSVPPQPEYEVILSTSTHTVTP